MRYSLYVQYRNANSSISFPGFKDTAQEESYASGRSVTRNNTGITRRDVPRDVASRSRLSGAGLHNATHSCSTELKNRGNDQHRRAGDRPGSKRASLQTPSFTYLTSLDCKTTRGHSQILFSPTTDRFSPSYLTRFTLLALGSLCHPHILYPAPLAAVLLNFRFNFLSSRLRSSTGTA